MFGAYIFGRTRLFLPGPPPTRPWAYAGSFPTFTETGPTSPSFRARWTSQTIPNTLKSLGVIRSHN